MLQSKIGAFDGFLSVDKVKMQMVSVDVIQSCLFRIVIMRMIDDTVKNVFLSMRFFIEIHSIRWNVPYHSLYTRAPSPASRELLATARPHHGSSRLSPSFPAALAVLRKGVLFGYASQ